PPPNIGGLIHAYRDGDILGVSLPPGTSWIRGEQVSDDPAIFTNYLYNVQFPPTPIGEFTGGIAYIGLEFAISGELHYGWLKVQLFEEDVTGSFYRPFANQILAFAYEDEAGVPIVAGVPEPVSLTLVSVVLPLLVARRRRPL
ncbi:MAG: motif protein, partial [Akkermansiaceae bacterium]|nr:motif protein [Akkermansiaceae bacterium]